MAHDAIYKALERSDANVSDVRAVALTMQVMLKSTDDVLRLQTARDPREKPA